MKNDFKNKESILGVVTGHGLAEHGERSDLCKYGKPVHSFQKEKRRADL